MDKIHRHMHINCRNAEALEMLSLSLQNGNRQPGSTSMEIQMSVINVTQFGRPKATYETSYEKVTDFITSSSHRDKVSFKKLSVMFYMLCICSNKEQNHTNQF